MTEGSSITSAVWRWPSITAWICFAIALGILLMFGSWQMDRLVWKRDLLDRVTTRMAATPMALGARIKDVKGTDYRRVKVTGKFRHDKEIYLAARLWRGKVGVHVITPLIRDGLPPVLVNRGWVPQANKDPKTRASGQVSGTVSVTGIARGDAIKRMFPPDNPPATGFWMTYDTHAMGSHMGIGVPLPMVVEVSGDKTAPKSTLPRAGVTRINFRNDHLQYAITWFALAMVLIVIFGIYHREKKAPVP